MLLGIVSYSSGLLGGSDFRFGRCFIVDSISVYMLILVLLLGVYSQLFFF